MDWDAAWNHCIAPNTPGKVATLGCFPLIFQLFVNAAFWLAGITAVILIVLAGAKMVLAEGDAKKLEGAHHTLTYAIIGLLIIFLALLIVSLVAYITGVSCLNTAGFTNCADNPVPGGP